MCFKDLTLVPIQTKMINPDLLTQQDEEWIDNYHKQVRGTSKQGHTVPTSQRRPYSLSALLLQALCRICLAVFICVWAACGMKTKMKEESTLVLAVLCCAAAGL